MNRSSCCLSRFSHAISLYCGAILAVVAVLFLSPAALALVTPGANLNYDAGDDDGSNTTWENTGATGGFNITAMSGQTHSLSPTTSLPGITGSYSFAGGTSGGNLATLEGLNEQANASFEMWIRPTDLTGDEVIFETGGGNGVGIMLGGGTNGNLSGVLDTDVLFTVTQNSQGSQTAFVASDLSGIGVGEFIQVVGTFDFTGNGTSTLYVNGTAVGSSTAAANITDWSGGDAAGVGRMGGANMGGVAGGSQGFVNYDGEVAIFRVYENKLLSADEVAANYNAIAGVPVYFDDDSADGLWETDDNWGPTAGAPASTQNAYIGGGLAAEITQPGAVADQVFVGHNQTGFNPGDGTLTIDDPGAALDAVMLRVGTDGNNGTVNFLRGTINLTGTSADQSLQVGEDNGSVGVFTMGTLGGNDADTVLNYGARRFEVARNSGATGTFTLNSGIVNGTQNFIVTQGAGTATVNIHGGSFTTTADMNYNSGNGTYLQDGGTVSVDDLNQSNVSGKLSKITVDGGTLTVRNNLDDRGGSSEINLGGTGTLELSGNAATRETDTFNQTGSSVLRMALYNNTTGVSAPLTVKNAGNFADSPTIELVNKIPASTGTIVDWVDGTDTWDADPTGKWTGDLLPADGANTIAAGTAITVITSPNDLTGAAALSSGTTGWTVNLPDAKNVEMVATSGVGGPATARISGATSIVTRNSDLFIAPTVGTDAAKLVLASDASLTLTGSSNLVIGGTSDGTVDHDGTLTVGGDLLFGGSASATQGGTYNLNGGSLIVSGDIVEGGSGAPSSGVDTAQLHINAGTLSVAGDITVQRFSVGESGSSSGATYTIPVSQTVYSTGTTVVGATGTNALLVVDGTLLANGSSYIGQYANSSGTMTINAGGSATFTAAAFEVADHTNSTATLNVLGGSLEVKDLNLATASGSVANVTVDGGTVNATSGINVAYGTGGTATMTIEDGSVVNVSGGNLETAYYGTGTVTMNGGTINQNSNNVIVGQYVGSDATFEMYGGQLTIAGSGQLRVTNREDVQGQFLLYGGTASVGGQLDTLNTAGANNTTTSALVVVDDTHLDSNEPAVLNVGTNLVLGNTNIDGGTSQMDLVSGTVNVSGNLTLAAGGTGQTATFNLSGGTLNMTDGNITLGAGTVAFNFTDGTLKDVGVFGGSLAQQGGTLAPGASPGLTTINGDYVVTGGGVLEIEVDGSATPGIDYDQLVVNGLVDLQDARLSVLLGYVPIFGDGIVIVDNDDVDPVVGLFKDDVTGLVLDEGATFRADNPTGYASVLTISYLGGTGNDIVLTAVPEPSTLVALLGLASVGLLHYLRRRRRK